MARPAIDHPAALVLGGGGVLGEAWMSGLLAGLEESGCIDARACSCYVGTSAGSIVAAALVAGVAPGERIERDDRGATAETQADAPRSPTLAQAILAAARRTGAPELGGQALAPLASLALRGSAGGGALLRRGVLGRVPDGRRSLAGLRDLVERSGAAWDGRLRLVAVELRSGRRVVFGESGAPTASVADAVCASCAIPGVFEPVVIGGREYVDGGVWSPTNLDVADVGRGESVLCLNPTGSLRPTRAAPGGALGSVSRGIAGGEALALRHRGASVHTVNPDARSLAAIGTNLMDPRRRGAVTAAALAQGRALGAASRRAA